MSFLDKLKKKVNLDEDKIEAGEKEEVSMTTDAPDLNVDIYRSPTHFILYALIPGVDPASIEISVEAENDVVVIEGEMISPFASDPQKEKMVMNHKECHWGKFYRQVMLPEEINILNIEAIADRGVLILKLPILRLPGGSKNIKVQEGSTETKEVKKEEKTTEVLEKEEKK